MNAAPGATSPPPSPPSSSPPPQPPKPHDPVRQPPHPPEPGVSLMIWVDGVRYARVSNPDHGKTPPLTRPAGIGAGGEGRLAGVEGSPAEVERYLAEIAERLGGPARARAGIVAELRSGL